MVEYLLKFLVHEYSETAEGFHNMARSILQSNSKHVNLQANSDRQPDCDAVQERLLSSLQITGNHSK